MKYNNILSDNIYNILDSNEISADIEKQGDEYYAELEFYSHAGEDFVFIIWFTDEDSFIDNFQEYAFNFDSDEHVREWIKNDLTQMSVHRLIDDAEEIEEFLSEVSHELMKCKDD